MTAWPPTSPSGRLRKRERAAPRDLILVSEALRASVTRCGIDRSYRKGPKPSDHAPLLLDLAN